MQPDVARREIEVPTSHGRIHCTIQGQGEPVVLLHGALGTGLAHFHDQVNEFASRYQVVVPDFLGYGKSQRRSSFDGDFYQRDKEDIAALVQYLNLAPAHLCGFSDGAIVAMLVAADHHEMLRSLVLIGGQAVLDEPALQQTRALAPAESLPAGFQRALARVHGDPYWKELVVDYVAAVERIYERGGDVAGYCLGNIHCPTLVVQGEADPWVGAEHAQTLRSSIPHSELVLFPGTGHEVQRERPQEFNRRVLEFLASSARE
ncbi:MAG: alpha/beta hydrolase [Chloroflexi bacterium]|nr:alpha/beta hydrolase [Chloroflexota bacterium]